MKNIAIIGGGVSGVVSAFLLSKQHKVTLFDQNDYLGGHTHTFHVPLPSGDTQPVDTGFIVFNNHTYPNFIKFLNQLNVPYGNTDMSFGYYNPENGTLYAGTDIKGLFAKRSNLINPTHWKFLSGIMSFSKRLKQLVETNAVPDMTLKEYVRQTNVSQKVIDEYIVPMTGAIWSSSNKDSLKYPLIRFAQFFYNHGLLSFENRPQWYYVKGGSSSYMTAFQQQFNGEIVLNSGVTTVQRSDHQVTININGADHCFDAVVIASHANESLNMLKDPTELERELLGTWQYSDNRVVLHSDTSFMPSNRNGWASWNYIREPEINADTPVAVTYHMNRLQLIEGDIDYLVTLNPNREIDPGKIHFDTQYTHPIYTRESIASQQRLNELNGYHNTYYCGSYFRNGFHEDAVWSAVNIGKLFGIDL